jgi:hypothetical protein
MNTTVQAAAAHVRASFAEKVERGIFAPVVHHLREDLVDERISEGIGVAYGVKVCIECPGAPVAAATVLSLASAVTMVLLPCKRE